jgi:hypothetical protein
MHFLNLFSLSLFSNQRLQTHTIRTPTLFALAAAAAAAGTSGSGSAKRGSKSGEGGSKIKQSKPSKLTPPPPSPSSRSSSSQPSPFTLRVMNSQVMESLGLKKRFITTEDLAAIKNRFLEAYIHKKPFQDETHIKLNETYDRFHFIVGTFERAISTLEKYDPSDFYSSFLYKYVIGALRKNSLYYEEVMKGNIDGEETAEDEGANDDDDDNNDDDNGRDSDGGGGGGDNRNYEGQRRKRQERQQAEEEYQQHYVRICRLATKYGIH